MPYTTLAYVKIPIKSKYLQQTATLKKYEKRQILAFLCFRYYVLGKAKLLQNKIIKANFPPTSSEKHDIYLIINERQKVMSPKYSFSFSPKIFINPQTIYIFGSIINKTCVFYGWIKGEELNKIKRFHPKGERKTYYVGDEVTPRVTINKWEHYSIKIEELKSLPEYNPQLKLSNF